MLSAGKDIKAVNTEASVAERLSFINFEVAKNLSNSSEIIYLDANWPILIRTTLKIVIFIPVHKDNTPY